MRQLEEWLEGYQLPAHDDPLYSVERLNLQLLKSIYALLALTTDQPTPQAAVHQYLPDFPDFPSQGPPSEALRILGLGRAQGPMVELKDRLASQLTADQAAIYLSVLDP